MSGAPVGPVHEQRVSSYWLDEEGIIRGVAKAGADYGLEDAKDGIRAHRSLSGGKQRALIVDISALRSMSREARAYYGAPEHAARKEAAGRRAISGERRMGRGAYVVGRRAGKREVPAGASRRALDEDGEARTVAPARGSAVHRPEEGVAAAVTGAGRLGSANAIRSGSHRRNLAEPPRERGPLT